MRKNNSGDINSSETKVSYVGIFIFWLVSIVILGGLLAVAAFFLRANWNQEALLQDQQNLYYLSQLQNEFTFTLSKLEHDISRLVSSPLLELHLQQPSSYHRELLQKSYLTLARARSDYEQIRFLDANGDEKIRINRSGPLDVYAEHENFLQNKAGRDYFIDGAQLPEGGIYLSPLDLNIENGQIEVPHKPMLRIVQPVYFSGRLQGQVIINYRAERMLERLSRALPVSFSPVLLNEKGQWLHGGDKKDWQFMFNPHTGLAIENPELWQEMTSKQSGRTTVDGDCLTYAWFSAEDESMQTPRWLMGFRESGQPCNALQVRHRTEVAKILVSGVLVGLLIMFAGHWLILRRIQLHYQLVAKEQQLRMVTNEVGNGLIIVDGIGLVKWMNPEAERLLGWTETELYDHNLHAVVHVTASGEVLHEGDCPTMKAISTRQRQQGNHEFFLTKDRELLPVSVVVSPLPEGPFGGGAVISFKDELEHLAFAKQLRHQAETDELTGCLNRRASMEYMNQLVDTDTCFGVIMFDLDYFKRINDTYGHAVGDKVLVEYSQLARALLRTHDRLCRVGGEEFLIVAEQLQVENLLQLAERIRISFFEHQCHVDEKLLKVTASFGVTMFRPGESVSSILGRVDRALYGAKNAGRNQVVEA